MLDSVLQSFHLSFMLDTLGTKLILLHLDRFNGLVKLSSHLLHALLHDGIGRSQISSALAMLEWRTWIINILTRLAALECDDLTFQHRVGLQGAKILTFLTFYPPFDVIQLTFGLFHLIFLQQDASFKLSFFLFVGRDSFQNCTLLVSVRFVRILKNIINGSCKVLLLR